MDDVFREIMFAGGNENLLAGDRISAVGTRRRFGGEQAKIRAALRLGQIHGAGPDTFDHLRQILLLQFVRGSTKKQSKIALMFNLTSIAMR